MWMKRSSSPTSYALKARIREGIAAGKAYLGFCLGHQLLAHVLGCRVGPLPRKSVGFITGELTPAGRRTRFSKDCRLRSTCSSGTARECCRRCRPG